MSEENKGQPPTGSGAGAGGQAPQGPGSGTGEQGAGNESQGSGAPETFDAEYVKRLRAEAADYRTKLRNLEAKVKGEEEAKLPEIEKRERKLAELERREADYQRERQEMTTRYEVMLAAGKLGIVDPDAAYRLLDLKQLEYDDDGQPKNIEKALKALVQAKPYLVGQTQTGGVTNPASGRAMPQTTFTRSQIADRKFWKEHQDEIMKALAEGRIVEG